MDLPLFSGSRPADIAVTGWSGLTVRIAWVLLAEGVRVRPTVLRDARDHVLYHLDPATPLDQAEDQAEALTRRFVTRARRKKLVDPWPTDWSMPLSPRWRRAIERSLSPHAEAVFRRHYGDGRPLNALEEKLGVDRIELEEARGGLREVVRAVAQRDGLRLEGWDNQRLDRLLNRLAAFAPDPCPPIDEVGRRLHREHARQCARCTRTLRLLKAGVLAKEDLEAPLGTSRPSHHISVLALHFHPDGRHHRARLARECDVPMVPVSDDLLILDADDLETLAPILRLAAEVGAPARDHLRGVLLEGPGRWSKHGLLGPVIDRVEQAVRSRSWGSIDTLGELPAPLPGPPSARRAWLTVGALAAVAVLSLQGAIASRPSPAIFPAEVSFAPARGGVWTGFDVDDEALVTLVRSVDGELDVVLASLTPADKAAFAVGDGSYRLHTMGQGILLASSRMPVGELEPLLIAAQETQEPLHELAARIHAADPRADVRTWPIQ